MFLSTSLSSFLCLAIAFSNSVSAHAHHEQAEQVPLDASDHVQELWASKYGAQTDLQFTGPLSFSHLPYHRCLDVPTEPFDIAILGFPFDTTTTYRPGARFGPYAIRSGSRRMMAPRGGTLAWGGDRESNPYDPKLGATVVDCGDVPLSAFSNDVALEQMETAYTTLLRRGVKGKVEGPMGEESQGWRERIKGMAVDGKEHPRIVTLGGDHTIVLPILRSLYQVYGPISVIHFDSHLDTSSSKLSGDPVTHGSYFTWAYEEGLMSNTSVHGGIRSKLMPENIEHDSTLGFEIISAEDVDDYGLDQVISAIRQRVGSTTTPVYLSLDIDVIDPALAPATGTPEIGGWTTREMKRIIRGLSGLNFVGADVVEVAPAYDNADITGIAAADIVHDFLVMMQLDEPPKVHNGMLAKAGVNKLH